MALLSPDEHTLQLNVLPGMINDWMEGMGENYVHSIAFPTLSVSKQTGKAVVYNRDDLMKITMEERAPLTRPNQHHLGFTTSEYTLRQFATSYPFALEQLNNADSLLDFENVVSAAVGREAMRFLEKRWLDAYFTDTAWTYKAGGVDSGPATTADQKNASTNKRIKWTAANSTPINDMMNAMTFMKGVTGFVPNLLIMSRPVYTALLLNEQLVGRINRGQTSGPAMVNAQNLAAMLGISNVLIADMAVSDGGDDLKYAAGNHAILLHAGSGGTELVQGVSCGYTLSWSGAPFGSDGLGYRVWDDPSIYARYIDAYVYRDFHKQAADLGFVFKDII